MTSSTRDGKPEVPPFQHLSTKTFETSEVLGRRNDSLKCFWGNVSLSDIHAISIF